MEYRGRILIYSITGCPHCMRAKNFFIEHSLPFTDVNLDNFPQERNEARRLSGRTTVPQIFFNAIHIGGCEDLSQLVTDSEQWQSLLTEVVNNPPPDNAPHPPDPKSAVDDGPSNFFECEPDEYALLVKELKHSGIIKDIRTGLTVHPRCFRGKDFVEWVMRTKGLDRQSAIQMGQLLVQSHYGKSSQGSQGFRDTETNLYQLIEDNLENALNAGQLSDCLPQPAGEVSESLRRLILKLYSAFISKDGKSVNYAGIAACSEFKNVYMRMVRELVRLRIEDETREAKIAFFINIYNALAIHAIIKRGPPRNLWQRYKFFNTNFYIIGGEKYSLQDIENGVLRSNRRGVGMLFRPFHAEDPRLRVALQQPEPRVHFALVCGAKSCPPIKTFSAAVSDEGIHEQLDLAAQAFLENDEAIVLNAETNRAYISQIFKWFREDFGRTDFEVLHSIHTYMAEGEKKAMLGMMLESRNTRINYLPYDWGSNNK